MASPVILHLSYLLLVVASVVTNILALRLLAIASGIAAMIYTVGIGEFSMVGWEAAFVLVNVAQAARLFIRRYRASLTVEEGQLQRELFPSLSSIDFFRLVRAARWSEAAPGERLTVQGSPVGKIALITQGRTVVQVDDRPIAHCRRGDFVGELAFISGKPASATTVALDATRCLVWGFDDLRTLLKKEPTLAEALMQVFSANLVEKLQRDARPLRE